MEAIRVNARSPYYLARRSDNHDIVDYAALPYREHDQVLRQASEIDAAATETRRNTMGQAVGINGQVSSATLAFYTSR